MKCMIRQDHYTTDIQHESNICSDKYPIQVNCSGIEYRYSSFTSSKSRHDFYLIYVIGGNMPVCLQNETQTLYPGNYIIIEPETAYTQIFSEKNIAYYWIHFTGRDVYRILKDLNITTNVVHKSEINESIENCFKKIFKEFVIRDSCFIPMTASLLIETLTYLSRSSSSPSLLPINSIKYIYDNYNKDISLEKLAAMENLSTSRFRTVFKNHTGESPLEFIITLRINTACHYLKNSSMSVEEISNIVGYTNPFYFSRLFKRKIGKSPKQYSKAHK